MKEVSLLPLDFRAEADAVLLEYSRRSARRLPWRENPTPYRVWVSEIMLQQTRAEVVARYYDRFLSALPTPRHLAEASPDRLSKLWEGLGYYRRASLMQRAAVVICEKYGGELPSDYHALRALPGFGDYTAGAVASFAFGLRAPAVDGNLLRVLARLFCVKENVLSVKTANYLRSLAWQMLPDPSRNSQAFLEFSKEKEGKKQAGAYLEDGYAAAAWNQAMMELGAQVCLPNTMPRCAACPLSPYCLACSEGCADRLPIRETGVKRREEQVTVLRITYENRYLIRRRSDKGLLAGLYEFPNLSGVLDEKGVREAVCGMGLSVLSVVPLPPARHVFTHLVWHLHGYEVVVSPPPSLPTDMYAPTKEELDNHYSIPGAFRAYRP